ncbi:MAG: hypothetical protein AMXMBFR46_28990 [Acidimicrobiia bacterium]
MLCVPAVRLDVEQVAVRVLPVPESDLAEHPDSDVPLRVKLTVPLGADPVTAAVNVTLAPGAEGLSELDSAVVVGGNVTTCDSVGLVEAALLASPENAATMLCVPAGSVVDEQVAVRVFPAPESALAEHPESEDPLRVKLTVPPGADPVTVAVKVTLAPVVAGLSELAIDVVVPGTLFTTCARAALVDGALMPSPE